MLELLSLKLLKFNLNLGALSSLILDFIAKLLLAIISFLASILLFILLL